MDDPRALGVADDAELERILKGMAITTYLGAQLSLLSSLCDDADSEFRLR